MDNKSISREEQIILKKDYIRIIHLPPMTVAEVIFFGETLQPGEDIFLINEAIKESVLPITDKTLPNHFVAGLNAIDKLIKDKKLTEIKSDFRLFGFAIMGELAGGPKMKDYGPFYGFGRWLSIPDDMEVPFPMIKNMNLIMDVIRNLILEFWKNI